MTKFRRKIKVVIKGTKTGSKEIVIEDYKINFEVFKSISALSQTLKLTITNLGPENQQIISDLMYAGDDKEKDNALITLSAGYEEDIDLPILFQGNPRNLEAYKEMPETITVIYARGVIYQGFKKDVNLKAFLRGSTEKDILLALLKEVDSGVEVIAPKNIPNGNTLEEPVTVVGSLEDKLKEYAEACDSKIFLGTTVVVKPLSDIKNPNEIEVIKLSHNSGLLGSPVVSYSGVNFEALLDARITPLSTIDIISSSIRLGISNAYYNRFEGKKRQDDVRVWINKATYIGSNYDNDWSILADGLFLTNEGDK